MFVILISSVLHVPRVFLDMFTHFVLHMVAQAKALSPKRLTLLRKVPNVAHLRVRAVSLNLKLSFVRRVLLENFIHFGKLLGGKVKGRSPKELK